MTLNGVPCCDTEAELATFSPSRTDSNDQFIQPWLQALMSFSDNSSIGSQPTQPSNRNPHNGTIERGVDYQFHTIGFSIQKSIVAIAQIAAVPVARNHAIDSWFREQRQSRSSVEQSFAKDVFAAFIGSV